jgi:hypothetical protein
LPRFGDSNDSQVAEWSWRFVIAIPAERVRRTALVPVDSKGRDMNSSPKDLFAGICTRRISRRAVIGGSIALGAGVVTASGALTGVRAATEVRRIAASNATATEKQAADYKCDGTNDYVEVIAALNSLPTTGGTLMLSSGTFNFGASNVKIEHLQNIAIVGQGIDITFVRNAPPNTADLEPFSYSDADGAIVKNMTISSQPNGRLTSDALDFDNSDNVLVENVKITASPGRGIVFDGKNQAGQPGWRSINNVVRNCEAYGCQRSGFEFLCADYSQIINCVAHDNLESGVNMDRQSSSDRKATHNTVSGGQFYNNGKSGITIYEGDFNTIDGAHCYNNNLDGIRIQTFSTATKSANGNQVLNCICTDTRSSKTQDYGVNLYGSPASDIDGTVIRDCDLRGNRVGQYKDVAVNTQISGLVGGTSPTPTATNTPTPSSTPPPMSGLFSDGFESGDLSAWGSSSGLVVQLSQVASGTFAARGTSSGTAAYARKAIGGPYSDIYFNFKFRVNSKDATTLYLGRFRTSGNASILGMYISSTGKLGYRNDMAAASHTSTIAPSLGAWHTLETHLTINGTSGLVETWLDGVRVDALCRTENLGTSAVGVVQVGDNSSGRTFDIVFDDAEANSSCVGTCPNPSPTATPTDTPQATNTPTPTNTAPAATDTPITTDTPTATDTAVPGTDTPTPTTSSPTPTAVPYSFTFEILSPVPPPSGGTVDIRVTMTSGTGPVLVNMRSTKVSAAVESPDKTTYTSVGEQQIVTLTDQTGPTDTGGSVRLQAVVNNVVVGQSASITFPAG